MKILMVSSYLPYPLFSGGQVRLYNLIKELSDKHEIILICEKRPHQTEKDVQELKKFCKKVITVPRRKQWTFENIAKSTTSLKSFLTTGHNHSQMQKHIEEELLKEKFDLIHVETFYVLQNVPVTSLPIVLVEHNIEYFVYQRFADRVPFAGKILLSLDIKKIKQEEEMAWTRAAKVVAVSELDKKIIEKKGIKSTVVANGVNIDEFKFKVKNPSTSSGHGEKKILFMGDFKWVQNTDAAKYIIKEIWPQIRLNMASRLWIVGRNIPESIRSLSSDLDIIFDEKSSGRPTPEIFQEATVLLAPIRVGGGSSYKILEAMSCGTPVVTMPLSADAINAKDGQEIMVGKNASELADKTVELLKNEKKFEQIAKNGRELIKNDYSWKNIAQDLEGVYKGVVA